MDVFETYLLMSGVMSQKRPFPKINFFFQILEEGGAEAVEERSHGLNFDKNTENLKNTENFKKVEKSKTFRSLSDTLDDKTIDKLLDQYLASLGSATDLEDENGLKERRLKVKAASIMNLLTDDLLEHLNVEATEKSDSKDEKQTTKVEKDEL